MMPKYFITKFGNRPSLGLHHFVDLENGDVLVRLEDRNIVIPAGAGLLPHINDHKTTVSPDHATKLAAFGVTQADTCFDAIMKVVASHPDMEP